MPPNRRLNESKCVFKNKVYGQFRERIVAQRYTKLSGVDFIKNYSPVLTDFPLCVILLMWLSNKWESQTIDTETEFLYTIQEEEIYTNMPEVEE